MLVHCLLPILETDGLRRGEGKCIVARTILRRNGPVLLDRSTPDTQEAYYNNNIS